jgi:hypothetical protein
MTYIDFVKALNQTHINNPKIVKDLGYVNNRGSSAIE